MHPFEATFGIPHETTAEAPGRINLLGEHTDYNDGFVLPSAIARKTTVDIAYSSGESFVLHSDAAGVSGEPCSYRAGAAPTGGYARYVHGCVEALHERGIDVPPVTMLIRSNVPIGAGLSSSAALEVSVLRALRSLLGFSLDDVELALTAQRAESHYVGVRCGIMDQMACSLAIEGHMVFIDTRTLERRLVPFPPMTQIIVLDSGVTRSLATSGYNERRAECEVAARALGVRALRDVIEPAVAAQLPAPLDRRARHVIGENARVLEAATGVQARVFGELMNESHASLRDDFEVSIPALDALVECLQEHPAVYGARLTGAGFGGACVALAQAGDAVAINERVLAAYRSRGYEGAVLV